MNEHGIIIVFTSTADGKQNRTQAEIMLIGELMF